VDLGAAVVANKEPLEVVQPREGAREHDVPRLQQLRGITELELGRALELRTYGCASPIDGRYASYFGGPPRTCIVRVVPSL
jgi:hypothetical protein